MRQTARVLVIGKSGSGKTTLARQIVDDALDRNRYAVIVNRKRELAEYAWDQSERIGGDDAPTAADLRRHIEHNRRVHFTVTAPDPGPFMDALGRAVLDLTAADPDGGLLLVVDEAHNFYAKQRTAGPALELVTGGRALGVHCVFVTQMLTSGTYGLDLTVVKQASHLFTFRLTERNEVARLAEMFPELGDDVTRLLRPERGEDGRVLPPEYGVKDLDSERAYVARRDGHRLRWREITA